jgi:hypothetical protein
MRAGVYKYIYYIIIYMYMYIKSEFDVCMQEYIENENARLEREQQFWQREIVVKIEYKFCPNLTIIDTPGPPPSLPMQDPALSCLPFVFSIRSYLIKVRGGSFWGHK